MFPSKDYIRYHIWYHSDFDISFDTVVYYTNVLHFGSILVSILVSFQMILFLISILILWLESYSNLSESFFYHFYYDSNLIPFLILWIEFDSNLNESFFDHFFLWLEFDTVVDTMNRIWHECEWVIFLSFFYDWNLIPFLILWHEFATTIDT